MLLVHKPRGATSAAVTRSIALDQASHAGTLDPFAEGLLVVLVGPAARLMDLFHEAPKTYRATIAWGVETSTGDPHGDPVARGEALGLTPHLLDAALLGFLGWSEQVPPATSAKKVGGEPAYRKAHRNEEVNLPPSRVYLHSARFVAHALPASSTLELVCRGGFYVRALARDLSRRLGVPAHLGALSRPAIGPWSDPGPTPVPVGAEGVLPWLPSARLTDAQMGAVKRGAVVALPSLEPPGWSFPPSFPPPGPWVRAFHLGRLVTLLRPDEGGFRTRYALGRGLPP